MAPSAFALLDERTQQDVTRALERCEYALCKSTPETVARDILKTRALREARNPNRKAAL